MMPWDLLAFRAIDAVRVEPFNQFRKTGRIVRVFALKLHQRIEAIGCARPFGNIAINFAHSGQSSKSPYIRQGDTYLCITITVNLSGCVSILPLSEGRSQRAEGALREGCNARRCRTLKSFGRDLRNRIHSDAALRKAIN